MRTLLASMLLLAVAAAPARADVIPDDPSWSPPAPPTCPRGSTVQHVFRGHGGQACLALDCSSDSDCSGGTGPCADVSLCTRALPDYAMIPQGQTRPDQVSGAECNPASPTCSPDYTCTTKKRCIGRPATGTPPQPRPRPAAQQEDDGCTVAAPGARSAGLLGLSALLVTAATLLTRRRR